MDWGEWVGIGIAGGFVVIVAGLVLGGYKALWIATTGEPFTFIVRRTYERFRLPIWIGLVALLGMVCWLQWDWAGPKGLAFALIYSDLVFLFGHFFWCGYRPGRLHSDSAYRILDNLQEYQRNYPTADPVAHLASLLKQQGVERPEDYRLPPLRLPRRRLTETA